MSPKAEASEAKANAEAEANKAEAEANAEANDAEANEANAEASEAKAEAEANTEANDAEGNEANADASKAVELAVNAKMRRTGICGAAETILIDRGVAGAILPAVGVALAEAGCAIRGDSASCELIAGATPADEEDWRTEYLDAILAVKIVDDLDAAVEHIAEYGSQHTEAIIAEDKDAAEDFMAQIDSAIVFWNAATQFADGGEFGMGAEIGIATGRLHARGPVGAEQLTTFRYVVRGNGQTRP